jgi:predicted ATP-binding protein involved in virulence
LTRGGGCAWLGAMRLTKVRVTGLFGLFNHEIPLNREARITIIHGPNGFGKTLVLRMLEALLVGRYSIFFEIPFETFAVEVEDGKCLMVRFVESIGHVAPLALKGLKLTISPITPEAGPSQSYDILEYHKGLRVPKSLLHRADIEAAIAKVLFAPVQPLGDGGGSTEERLAKNSSEEPEESWREPGWLSAIRSGLPKTRFIRTQRLDVLGLAQSKTPHLSKPAVQAFAEDMSARIEQVLAEYAARSQELDRTFPVRLFNQKKEPLAAEELRKRLSELEQKRSRLTRLGFLDQEQGVSPAPVEAIETKRDVLSVYVDDADQKLAVFDDLAIKIELFKRIINERFLFKRLDVQRDKGFVFTSQTGAALKPSDLSSGEQHEFILLYELLFKLEKNALVLIDEPEISLHVAWQEKFLDDLQEVVKLSEIDVIVATHSPEIIGEHWDLTVELKGPTLPRQE